MTRTRRLSKLYPILIALLVATVSSMRAHAYPVLLHASQIPGLFGTVRNHLIAVRADASGVQRVPLQIDEIEDDAALVLRQPYEIKKLRENLAHPQKTDPFAGRLQSVHRVVLDDRDFAVCSDECQKKIPAQIKTVCNSAYVSQTLKVTLFKSQKTLFIADCGVPAGDIPAREVKYTEREKTVSTAKYDYVHSSDKNVFFSEIRTRSEKRPLLTKSEIKAHLKPKYLFNMKFKDDDLVSQITSLSRGPLSLNMEVAVALNILAMKVNTQICCDVSFFEDALYFPVVLDLPFSGNSFAKGSGLFFGFQTDTESTVKTEFIQSQNDETSDVILIQQGKNLIALGFRTPNKAQATSVRPKIVSKVDIEALNFMPIVSPSGIFYDIQTARQGFQHFMVWMLFGNESEREKLIEYAQYGTRVQIEKFTNPSGL